MEFISPDDYLEIRFASILTDFDRKVICELYQPLIGHTAIAVYLTLWSEREQSYNELLSHDRLFSLMQINTGEFTKARLALEAVGLIKTYFKTENSFRFFVYEIYAPKTPAGFFEDALFSGLLNQYLGEKEASRLASSFRGDDQITGFTEISSRFADVFKPDLNDPVFKVTGKSSAQGRVLGKVDISFDFNVFLSTVETKGLIKKSAFSKPQLDEIERISTLYGIDEETMAEHVLSSYHPDAMKEERIDFYRLGDLCREETRYPYARKKSRGSSNMPTSSSAIAEKIKLMEGVSPKDYLRIKQNNTSPAKPDLLLIDDLSGKFNLANSVINALVDYVLEVNKNVLSRAYTEKIAASLAREKVTTAIDAMNYLKKIISRKKPVRIENKKPDILDIETPTIETKTSPQAIDEDYAAFIEKYSKKGDDEKHE
jgi:replication initiation and membrane attachment protein